MAQETDDDAPAAPDATLIYPGASSGARGDEGSGQVAIGSVLNHIYEVRRFIARGGMGEVYEGVNVNTDERVAIKIVLPHMAADPNVHAMFRKEARVLTRLSHPALVQYRVLAREPALGVLYIVTDYLDGVGLDQLIGKLKLAPPEVLALMKRLAEGLKVAHDLGAIHRDISPDNILLPGERIDAATIIDFGIAKDLDASHATIVGQGFAGKLAFVAPEQFGDFGREIGPWTDLYSLGLVMLAVAGGKEVDMGKTLVEAVDRRRAGPDLSALPSALQPLFGRMLAANPKDRFASMAELLEAVAKVDLGGSAPPAVSWPAPPEPAEPPKPSDLPEAARPIDPLPPVIEPHEPREPPQAPGSATSAKPDGPADPTSWPEEGQARKPLKARKPRTPPDAPLVQEASRRPAHASAPFDLQGRGHDRKRDGVGLKLPLAISAVVAILAVGGWFALQGSAESRTQREAAKPVDPANPMSMSRRQAMARISFYFPGVTLDDWAGSGHDVSGYGCMHLLRTTETWSVCGPDDKTLGKISYEAVEPRPKPSAPEAQRVAGILLRVVSQEVADEDATSLAEAMRTLGRGRTKSLRVDRGDARINLSSDRSGALAFGSITPIKAEPTAAD